MTPLPPFLETALLWAVWCFLHSLLICRSWTGRLRAALGERFAWYRLFYTLFSLLTLAAVVGYQFSRKQVILFSWNGWWMLLPLALYLYAGIMFHVGWKRYDLKYFLGFSQVKGYLAGESPSPAVFNPDCRGGVRHPWYSGGIALVWAIGPVTDVSLAIKVVLTVYFLIGTFLEERKLLADFGDPYAEYCSRVPMFLPRWKR
ncbi:MAG: hypothetical protein BM485_06885 [Desulfobulbaceae bacterium DB1]|nr:MAG: hypothetical protein BM485_06885 [Desulfobulbaceae bacterium DB1]